MSVDFLKSGSAVRVTLGAEARHRKPSIPGRERLAVFRPPFRSAEPHRISWNCSVPLSVLIMTKNEIGSIAGGIESVPLAGEINAGASCTFPCLSSGLGRPVFQGEARTLHSLLLHTEGTDCRQFTPIYVNRESSS